MSLNNRLVHVSGSSVLLSSRLNLCFLEFHSNFELDVVENSFYKLESCNHSNSQTMLTQYYPLSCGHFRTCQLVWLSSQHRLSCLSVPQAQLHSVRFICTELNLMLSGNVIIIATYHANSQQGGLLFGNFGHWYQYNT